MLVGASCTAELIQDDPGGLAQALRPARARWCRWSCRPTSARKTGAPAETFYQLVRALAGPSAPPRARRARGGRAPAALQPARAHRARLPPSRRRRARSRGCSTRLGVDVNVVAPLGASACRHRAAWARPISTSCSTPRSPRQAAQWLQRSIRPADRPRTVPIGVGATRDFIAEVAALAGVDAASRAGRPRASRLPWYSRSVDSTYLTGKRVFIFGDATPRRGGRARRARGAGLRRSSGLGTYSREFARDVRDGRRALRRRGR
jgi:light-independent protochlorophyllide reductase subunit B